MRIGVDWPVTHSKRDNDKHGGLVNEVRFTYRYGSAALLDYAAKPRQEEWWKSVQQWLGAAGIGAAGSLRHPGDIQRDRHAFA